MHTFAVAKLLAGDAFDHVMSVIVTVVVVVVVIGVSIAVFSTISVVVVTDCRLGIAVGSKALIVRGVDLMLTMVHLLMNTMMMMLMMRMRMMTVRMMLCVFVVFCALVAAAAAVVCCCLFVGTLDTFHDHGVLAVQIAAAIVVVRR